MSRWYPWNEVDWELTNVQIASKLGCTVAAVAGRRAKMGIAPSPMQRKMIDWDGVDWSMTNRDIAQQLGCAHRAVSDARRRLNKPKSSRKTSEETKVAIKKKWKTAMLDVEWDLLCGVVYEPDTGLPTYSDQTMKAIERVIDDGNAYSNRPEFRNLLKLAGEKVYGDRIKAYTQSSDPRVVGLRERLKRSDAEVEASHV